MRKPMIAGQKLVPELTPTIGGKIRLPAPKNIENSVNEAMTMVSSGEETFDFAGADATVSDINVPVLRNCRCAKWSSKRGRRSEEHTSELQSRFDLVCRLLLEKKNK